MSNQPLGILATLRENFGKFINALFLNQPAIQAFTPKAEDDGFSEYKSYEIYKSDCGLLLQSRLEVIPGSQTPGASTRLLTELFVIVTLVAH